MSGILAINMPGFLQGVNYLSPMPYVTRNLAPYSLRHITFYCTAAQKLPDGSCPITTGKQALDLYKLNTNPARNIMALGICTLIYRILAYVLLKAMRMHWGKNKVRQAGRSSANSATIA
jgi:hypothetical protein